MGELQIENFKLSTKPTVEFALGARAQFSIFNLQFAIL